MTLFQPRLRASLLRAFLVCLLGLGALVGLVLFLTDVTQAQTGLIMVQKNQAQVRYREGVQFTISAGISGGELNPAQLKVQYGKKGREETYTANFVSGIASYMVYDDAQSLATGMPLTYSWILSDGKVQLQTNSQTVIYEDTHRTWYQREGPQVTVRWYNGDNNYGNLMYQLAADTLATYKRRFNMDPQNQIYITIYGSSAAYHSTFSDVPEWSGGFSRYGGVEIVAIAPQDMNSSIFIGEGIPHELSHAAVYQFLQTPAPRWLDEGFAVYNQNIISIKEYDQMLQQAYRTGTLIPLSVLNNRWPADETMARLAYAEGRSVVTFLINSYGNEVWSNLLDQLRRQNVDKAFNTVLGVDLAQIEELWKNNVLGGVQLALPAVRKAGPVSSQPTAQDFAIKTGLTQTPAQQAPHPTASDDGLLWMLLGIALVAVFTLVGLSLIVVRNRHREAVLYRFKPRPGEIDIFSKITPGFYPASLPPAISPISSIQPPINAAYPLIVPPPVGQGFSSNFGPGQSAISPAWLPAAQALKAIPISTQASGADPFDFISASFDQKSSSAKTYSAGAFLDLDPYGLDFEPVADTNTQKAQG